MCGWLCVQGRGEVDGMCSTASHQPNSIAISTNTINTNTPPTPAPNPEQKLPEFRQRVAVLRDLGYVDGDNGDTVTLKGRAACEINSTQVSGY